MNDVKWIKLTTDMFDNRKIRHLRRLPDGDSVVLIWVMLLTMAGRCNAGGMIFLTENIPYTPKLLADELDFEENTVVLALDSLERLNMIVRDGDFFSIAGWEEYQNIDGMERIRESKRVAQAKWRAKQKAIAEVSTVDSTEILRNTTEVEEELRIKNLDKEVRVNYQLIADMYNEICISFPRLTALSDSRKKTIKARMNTYTEDDFRTLFQKAEQSDFLKGKNKQDWRANFDWLLKDSNMAKVLDGNYDNKDASQPKANKGDWSGQNDKYFDDARKYIQLREQYRKAATGK